MANNPEDIQVVQHEVIERKRGGKFRTAVVAGALAVAGLIGLKLAGEMPDFGTETQRDLKKPEIVVEKIDAIDLGCFVNVQSRVNLQLNEHHVATVKVPFLGSASKSYATDTTRAHYKGEGQLCADDENSTVTVVRDDKAKTVTMDVNIGDLHPRGYILHNGHDGESTEYSPLSRVALPFSGDSKNNVRSGLALAGQTIFQRTPCLEDAVKVAKSSINEHYVRRAAQDFGGYIATVNVAYDRLPDAPKVPVGHIDGVLKQMGMELPDNWDIVAKSPVCDVVEINGQRAKSE